MFDDLDTVDWIALEHAYGSAADVPGLLWKLLSNDPRERLGARWHLYGNILHQGRRFEASAYAAPFLLELLAEPTTHDREAIIELSTALAIGYDESWLPDGFPVAACRARAAGGEELLRAAPRLHGNDDDWNLRSAYWKNLDTVDRARLSAFIDLAAYDAVRRGVPLLRALLTDAVPAVRTAAGYALSWFPEEAPASLPALLETAEDPDAPVAATALVAICLIGSIEHARAVEWALDDPRDDVRWAAAIALARLRGGEAGARVAAELIAWCGGSTQRHRDIPFLDGDLAGYAALALRQLDAAGGAAAFDALLSRLQTVRGTEALPVVAEALRRAFPDGPLPAGAPFDGLDDRQRRLVLALTESDHAWGGPDYWLLNFSELVRAYGLPDRPDWIRAYVAESRLPQHDRQLGFVRWSKRSDRD